MSTSRHIQLSSTRACTESHYCTYTQNATRSADTMVFTCLTNNRRNCLHFDKPAEVMLKLRFFFLFWSCLFIWRFRFRACPCWIAFFLRCKVLDKSNRGLFRTRVILLPFFFLVVFFFLFRWAPALCGRWRVPPPSPESSKMDFFGTQRHSPVCSLSYGLRSCISVLKACNLASNRRTSWNCLLLELMNMFFELYLLFLFLFFPLLTRCLFVLAPFTNRCSMSRSFWCDSALKEQRKMKTHEKLDKQQPARSYNYHAQSDPSL